MKLPILHYNDKFILEFHVRFKDCKNVSEILENNNIFFTSIISPVAKNIRIFQVKRNIRQAYIVNQLIGHLVL